MPFKQAKLEESLERPARFGSNGSLDLTMFRASSGDRPKHLLRKATHFAFRRKDKLALAEKSATRRANEASQVLPERLLLVPPGEIERYSPANSPDKGSIGGRKTCQQLRRLVRAEGVEKQEQVEATVEGRPLLLDRGHRCHGRAAQKDPQSGVLARPVPEGAKPSREIWRNRDELWEFIEHEQ